MSPGRNESPGVTLGFSAAARRSASQPIQASASTVTMKIFRKVSMTLLAIDWARQKVDLGPKGVLLHHNAWNVGRWQLLRASDPLDAAPRAATLRCREPR